MTRTGDQNQTPMGPVQMAVPVRNCKKTGGQTPGSFHWWGTGPRGAVPPARETHSDLATASTGDPVGPLRSHQPKESSTSKRSLWPARSSTRYERKKLPRAHHAPSYKHPTQMGQPHSMSSSERKEEGKSIGVWSKRGRKAEEELQVTPCWRTPQGKQPRTPRKQRPVRTAH